MQQFAERMLALDRRWVYLMLSIVLVISLLAGREVTPVVMDPVRQFYDCIEQASTRPEDGQIIVVNTVFSSNTMGESGNQARAIIRHLMLSRKRFAIVAIGELQGAVLGRTIVEELAKQYHYQYGVDWIDFGFQLRSLAFYKSFPTDLPGTIKVDAVENKPLADFPIMRGVRNAKQISLWIEITASSSVADMIAVVQPMTKPRLKIIDACTGVMATEAYPWLDSGQLVGMLPGLKGASDYELLVDRLQDTAVAAGTVQPFDRSTLRGVSLNRSAREMMFTQNYAHIFIILLIALGNIAYFITRRQPKPVTKEETHG